ncbi:sensor histidine kinase [Alloalcanivorax gelatiniphagus]
MTTHGTAERPWLPVAASVVLAVGLAALALPAGLGAVRDGELGVGWRWVLGVTLVALHVTLLPPLVTRFAHVAFGVGSALMLVLVAAPDLGGVLAAESGGGVPPVLMPSGLVWFVLLYAVSARTSAPWPSLALTVGLVGCLLTTLRLWDDKAFAGTMTGAWWWRLFLVAAVLGGTLAAWAMGRYRAGRLAWTAATAERAAAEERRRIAREMHDVVAHSLAVVVAQAEGGRMLAERQPDRAAEVLEGIAAQGREALAQMRGLLGVLRDDDAPDGAAAPQPTIGDVPALVAQVRRTGRDVELVVFGDPRPVGAALGLTAYRVVQESLTNVVKHAGPEAAARVEVDWTDGLVVTVVDDGRTVAPQAASPGGRGLGGMRERVAAVGGQLEAGPAPGGGWRTCARMPA